MPREDTRTMNTPAPCARSIVTLGLALVVTFALSTAATPTAAADDPGARSTAARDAGGATGESTAARGSAATGDIASADDAAGGGGAASANDAALAGDPLLAALADAGVPPDAIGFRPDGTWLRYPDPAAIRFKSRLFDTFFSDPGTIYPTIAVMARAAERFLEPAYSDTESVALFKLAYWTGWDPHLAGFRDYNAGMTYTPKADEPLLEAIARLWVDAGRTFDPVSFESPAEWPALRDQVRAQVAPLDDELEMILAQAVLDLLEARQWHRRAFRNVDYRNLVTLWNVRDWGDTQADGGEYFPQVEEIADQLDHASLVTSSRKTVYAAGRLATSLRAWESGGGGVRGRAMDGQAAGEPSRARQAAGESKDGRAAGERHGNRTAQSFADARFAPDPDRVTPEEGKLSAVETRLYTERDGTRAAERAAMQLDLWTPAGRIVVTGSGDDVHEERDVLLLVDLGGHDTYREPVGATSSLNLPVAIAVDLAGNDRYEAADEMTATQGSGIFGTGVLVEVGGDDVYSAGRCAQGYGFFGTGLLADFGGQDLYLLGTGGQGAGFWGVGLLADRGGDDVYAMNGVGQGYGGIGGVGTLVDYAGNDRYGAETDSRRVPRPDYTHSAEYVNGTSGQGSGMGRRGDISDGHSWAGGLGTLLDLSGDDDYVSGNWTLGSGYWYGMGFVYDKAGNDRYRATTFSIASGAHFCVGGLFDEGGDDVYEGIADARTGMGFGHDFTVAILFDRNGDDVYRFGWEGIGEAINMSQAFFVDGSGDDTYVFDAGRNGFGMTNFDPAGWPPPIEANYQSRATQIGLFLDLGGQDRYLERDAEHALSGPGARDGRGGAGAGLGPTGVREGGGAEAWSGGRGSSGAEAGQGATPPSNGRDSKGRQGDRPRGVDDDGRHSAEMARPGESASALLHDDLVLLRPADPSTGDDHHYGIFRDGTGEVEAIRWFQAHVR